MSEFRVIGKRSNTVWLLTTDEGDPPKTARVLDLEQLKLFPPYPTESIIARGYWEPVPANDQPDVESMMRGVDRMDTVARDHNVDPAMSPRVQ
jgi:hypothetical protein